MRAVAGWSRSASDIVAEVEMVRTNFRGGFLVVEGASDECFFRSRIAKNVYVVDACGKRNVEETFALLDSDASHKRTIALGVVDEDYDWLTGHACASVNIVKFDPRDLEGFLMRSSALDAVLAEFSDVDMVRAFESANGMSVREAVLLRSEVFGRIRMVNSTSRGVCLKKFKPQRFCDVSAWSYDYQEIMSEAVNLGVSPDVTSLQASMSRLTFPSAWHAARGHDLIDILVGGLKGVLGGVNVGSREVERVLRQAVQRHEISDSGFFERLSRWQVNNGFTFLP